MTDTRPPAAVTGVTPGVVDIATPPPAVTVSGARFADSGFGLPLVNVFRDAAFVGQVRATSGTGSAITVPLPGSLLAVGAGPLRLEVYNQTGASSYVLVGATTLTLVVNVSAAVPNEPEPAGGAPQEQATERRRA